MVPFVCYLFILGDLFYCLFVLFFALFVCFGGGGGVITMYVTSTFVYRLLVSL